MTPKIPKQVKSKPTKFDVRQNLSDGLNNLTENNQPKKAINNRIPKRKFLQGAFYNEFRVLNYKKLIIQMIFPYHCLPELFVESKI